MLESCNAEVWMLKLWNTSLLYAIMCTQEVRPDWYEAHQGTLVDAYYRGRPTGTIFWRPIQSFGMDISAFATTTKRLAMTGYPASSRRWRLVRRLDMAGSTEKLLVSKAVRDKFGLSFIMMVYRVTTWVWVRSPGRAKEA